jgi:hypothetical protein
VAGNLVRGGRLLSYKNATTADLYTTILNTLDQPASSFGWKGTAPNGRPFNNGPLAGWT